MDLYQMTGCLVYFVIVFWLALFLGIGVAIGFYLA